MPPQPHYTNPIDKSLQTKKKVLRRTKKKKFGIEEYGLAFFANVAENRRESHSCTTIHHHVSAIASQDRSGL